MKKGQKTKRRILEKTAPVFNTQGFRTTTLSEVLSVTGLQKGGIYNHFRDKEELALEAFDYIVPLVQAKFAFESENGSALASLLAGIEKFRNHRRDSPIPGGCPLLNCAIESDDAFPKLHRKVSGVVQSWHSHIQKLVQRAKEAKELSPDTDPALIATVIIATLEGGVFLDRLFPGSDHLSRCCDHLLSFVLSQCSEAAL
jgi:TetR/AcrR family transcriptional repressor of nem operon